MCVLLKNSITLAFGNNLSYLFCEFPMCYLLSRNKKWLHFFLATFAGHWSIGGNLSRLVNCYRGNVAEWSACWTHNPAVPGSSPAMTTTWICFSVAQSSNPRPRLQEAKWFPSGQLGFLTMLSSV